MSDPVLELSTQIEPAAVFTVDGEEFKLLGFRHLDADGEAEVMAHLARFEGIAVRLASTDDDTQAKKLAGQLRDRRCMLISKLTDLPSDRVMSLPLPQQVRLMKAIQQIAGLGGDGDN